MRSIFCAVILAIVVLLTGCAGTPADTCRSYGFSPGSEAFAGCVQREIHQLQTQMNFLTYQMSR